MAGQRALYELHQPLSYSRAPPRCAPPHRSALAYSIPMVDAAPSKGLESGAPEAMGKYAPFARLGNGGMADVFLALARGPVGFNKLAVVKRLRNPGNETHVSMFLD